MVVVKDVLSFPVITFPVMVSSVETENVLETIKLYCYVCRVWLAKCWKIRQLAYLCSTKYIFILQFTVIFNTLYLCSTIRILFSYSTKLFSFNNNIYSTSIAIFILLNQINCSTSVQTFYSTTIIIQLLPCIFCGEVFESSQTFEISLFNKFPVPSPVKYAV